MLIIVTSQSRIRGIDLRTMKEIWHLHHPPQYGEISALLSNKRGHWIMVGTSRGVLCLWDTRFKVCLKTWTHPLEGRITKLASYIRDPGRLVAVSSANEISLWDISTTECVQVWASIYGNAKEGSVDDATNKLYGSGFKVCCVGFFLIRCIGK